MIKSPNPKQCCLKFKFWILKIVWILDFGIWDLALIRGCCHEIYNRLIASGRLDR